MRLSMTPLQSRRARKGRGAGASIGLLIWFAFLMAPGEAAHAGDARIQGGAGGQAAQTPAVPSISSLELTKRPLAAGQFEITITKLDNIGLFHKWGFLDLTVVNEAASFSSFNPSKFLLVNSKNNQINIEGRREQFATDAGGLKIVTIPEIDIAPRAKVKCSYLLSGKINLPARVYYDRTLIATVTP